MYFDPKKSAVNDGMGRIPPPELHRAENRRSQADAFIGLSFAAMQTSRIAGLLWDALGEKVQQVRRENPRPAPGAGAGVVAVTRRDFA
jgi:hypothetical protein